MAHRLAGQASSGQHTTPPRKPALVAYSDSDSESSSSDTTGPVVNSENEVDTLVAAEQSMTLSTRKKAATAMASIDNSNPAAGRQEQLARTTIKMKERVAEVSHGHDQARNPDTNMVEDDETIPDIKNGTRDIDVEAAFGGREEQAKGSSDTPRCWGDIKYPRIGTCDHEFKIANSGERYRKVVSDFFGRNKKATASVPPECYPTICRTCYQRLAYRLGSMNKDDPEKDAAAVAKLRCDAIIAALEKMKEKTFFDHYGYEWPWWCGLELQLTNDGQALLKNPEELEAEIDKKNEEVAIQQAEKAKSPKGKSFKRLHKRVKPDYLPDWLQKLCQRNTEDDVTADAATSTIGHRNGVRYSFDELVLIIKAIKTFCHESRCGFPTIEAIPVPIGLLDEQIVKEKRKLRAAANNMKAKTKKDAMEADNKVREQPSSTLRKTRATSARKVANDALAEAEKAEKAVDNAQEDASLSAGTSYDKRFTSHAKLTCKIYRYNSKKETQVRCDTSQAWQAQVDSQASEEAEHRERY